MPARVHGRPRRRSWFWSGVVAALVLTVAGGVLAYRGYHDTGGPTAVARAYFAALQRGDAASALAFGDVPPGSRQLLTAAVLREQQALGPLRNVVVEGVSASGDRATVRVRYDVALASAPQQVDDAVPVVRRHGDWYLARVAVRTRLALVGAQDRATVLGQALPRGPVLLFPGAAPIRFDSPYLRFGPDSGTVDFSSGDRTLLPVQLSPGGRQAVMSAVAAALRRCLSGIAPLDPRCPLPDDTYVPGSIRGRLLGQVQDAVQVELQAGPSGLIAVSGTVAARVSFERLTYADVRRTGHGTVQLDVSASAYATDPLELNWTSA